ncbi:MAG: hypothetical protein J0I20_35420 [Chloroflexi bacterium]|nr:hypothetical protein [Chloroflexota bacterium]OJV88339.1 MAG: hypothetical protein BGO39_23975 [Chloroflexi bacterium 54-19]
MLTAKRKIVGFSLTPVKAGIILLGLLGLFVTGNFGQGRVASAHEARDLANGKYQMRIGFIFEPAYQGLENGLFLAVCTGVCKNNPDNSGTFTNGVTGLFDSLKAEVIFGSQSMSLTLVPVPRTPGVYNARFVPTRTGNYTYHISGKINEDSIDERFSSSPTTFDSIQALTLVQFPDKPGYATGSASPSGVSAGADENSGGSSTAVAGSAASGASSTAGNAPTLTPVAPSTPVGQATSSGAGTATGNSNTNGSSASSAELLNLQQQVDNAKNSSTTAMLFGIAGIVLGLIGLTAPFISRWFRNRPKTEIEGG